MTDDADQSGMPSAPGADGATEVPQGGSASDPAGGTTPPSSFPLPPSAPPTEVMPVEPAASSESATPAEKPAALDARPAASSLPPEPSAGEGWPIPVAAPAVAPPGTTPPLGTPPSESYPPPPAASAATPKETKGSRWVAVAVIAAVIGALVGSGVTAFADHHDNTGESVTIHESNSAPGAAVLSGNVTIPELVKEVLPAVVSIDVKAGGNEDEGTGMIITSDGEVVTNNHVIELFTSTSGGSITVTESGQTKALPATLIGYDTTWLEPAPLLQAGLYWPGLERATLEDVSAQWAAGAPVAALVFYRALVQAADLAPIDGLIAALQARGLNPLPLFVASLRNALSASLIG